VRKKISINENMSFTIAKKHKCMPSGLNQQADLQRIKTNSLFMKTVHLSHTSNSTHIIQ